MASETRGWDSEGLGGCHVGSEEVGEEAEPMVATVGLKTGREPSVWLEGKSDPYQEDHFQVP